MLRGRKQRGRLHFHASENAVSELGLAQGLEGAVAGGVYAYCMNHSRHALVYEDSGRRRILCS